MVAIFHPVNVAGKIMYSLPRNTFEVGFLLILFPASTVSRSRKSRQHGQVAEW